MSLASAWLAFPEKIFIPPDSGIWNRLRHDVHATSSNNDAGRANNVGAGKPFAGTPFVQVGWERKGAEAFVVAAGDGDGNTQVPQKWNNRSWSPLPAGDTAGHRTPRHHPQIPPLPSPPSLNPTSSHGGPTSSYRVQAASKPLATRSKCCTRDRSTLGDICISSASAAVNRGWHFACPNQARRQRGHEAVPGARAPAWVVLERTRAVSKRLHSGSSRVNTAVAVDVGQPVWLECNKTNHRAPQLDGDSSNSQQNS